MVVREIIQDFCEEYAENETMNGRVYRFLHRQFIEVYNKYISVPMGTVLMLHRIGEIEHNRLECIEELKVTPEHLQRLVDEYRPTHDFVSLDHVADCMEGRVKPLRPFICITLDDGFRDNLSVGLPFFEKNQIPFAVFLTAEFMNRRPAFNYPFILERMVWNNAVMTIAGCTYDCSTRAKKNVVFKSLKGMVQSLPYVDFETRYRELFKDYLKPAYEEDLMMSWDEVRELANSPLCTIGSHAMTHCRLANVPKEHLVYELGESKLQIEKQIGTEIRYVSYPFGWTTDVSEQVFEATRTAGYRMGLISWGGPVRRKDRDMYQVKRQMLFENE